MKPDELIQILRNLKISQIRLQLEEDYTKGATRYDHLTSFILAAQEQQV